MWLPFQFCIVISGLFLCVMTRDISRALDFAGGFLSNVCCSESFIPNLNSFFSVLKARLLLKLAAKVTLKS